MSARILGLEAENVKRLRAIEITFKDGLTVIGGKNKQGKSSTLDAIAMVLGGKALVPGKPVHTGKKSGHATVTLEQGDLKFRVTRKFGSLGTTSLTIEDATGKSVLSPQRFLDSLLGSLSFDPLEFSRMKPRERAETLRDVVGLDTSEIERDIELARADRTEQGREKRRLGSMIETMPLHEGVPDEEHSVAGLSEKVIEANRIADQKEELADRIRETRRKIDGLNEELDRLKTELNATISEHDAMTVPDVSALTAQLDSAESTNSKVRANRERKKVMDAFEKIAKDHARLDRRVQELEEKRTEMIESAEYPIAGLAVDENGVSFNGVPWEQASQAEQLIVSVTMGFAMNPKLKLLLVHDGSLLDEDSLALVAKLAAEENAQVIMERVGVDKHTTILIEDGEVVHSSAPPIEDGELPLS